MLLRLKITNYALISESEITFNKGLTVITGETGAGKSILMGALSIVLGARADTSVIKQGEKKTIVEAEFNIKTYNLKSFFESNDLDYDNTVIIRREVLDSGKSRAFVNDTPVNINTLKDLGLLLTDIHSQHQTLQIADSMFQMGIVDAFAANKEILNQYKTLYSKYCNKKSQLTALENQAVASRKESEYLTFRFNELDQAALQEDEQQQLEEELEILSHNEDVKNAISLASNLIINAEEQTVVQKLKEAQNALSHIAAYYTKAAELNTRIESAYVELNDIGRELQKLDDNTEFSPDRIETVNQRLTLIYNLQKKNGVSTIAELLAIRNDYKNKLDLIDNSDEIIGELKAEIKALSEQLQNVAQKLSQSRYKAAKGLETEVVTLLSSVGIANAQFSTQFNTSKEFLPHGIDEVKFMFSANKNVAIQDLSKTASGGELSRLMLCLKYILSKSVNLPTIIFDEIDTGISGDIAGKTGAMFRRIAEFMQVICITHLPQVAAMGNYHYKVYKYEEQGAIRSNIKPLSPDERVNEIAAMLSGETITQAALQNAKDLLKATNS